MRASALEGAKLCAGIFEEVAKKTLWSKLSSRKHSDYCCREEDSDLYRSVDITLYATPWVDTYHRFNAENDQDLLFRREHNAS
ncbi:hypothetical protein PV326_004397 [Microctonus aethiopoides]|nr:hypothetical protein PV326_004397 [Microctonus aethiopoides]